MRLVCIVEGHGEVDAVPTLCARIIKWLGVDDEWFVDSHVIRQPRDRLVDVTEPLPKKRTCNVDGIERVLELALARKPGAVLILCDADDECPAIWGPSCPKETRSELPVASVMASREYESWILCRYDETARTRVRATNPDAAPRDAKGALRKLNGGTYKPTLEQKALSPTVSEIASIRRLSSSFDKLVCAIARLAGTTAPALSAEEE